MNKLLLLFFIYSANFISHNRDENKCLNIINNHNKIKRNILSRDLSVFYVKKEKNIGLNSIIKTDKLKKDGNSLLDYSTSFDHKTEIYNNVKKKK